MKKRKAFVGDGFMTVRMTKKLQKSLGIKEIPSSINSEKPKFLDEWYMNIFNIRKQWFFIMMESTTFYTIVKPYYAINGSQDFIDFFMKVILESFNKENRDYYFKDFQINEMHLRNTENKAPRRIIVDMAYHAEIKKYEKGKLEIFDELNEIPQALLGFKYPKEVYRDGIKSLIKECGNIIDIN